MKLMYWKTISSAFLVAAANYWFGQLFINTFANVNTQLEQQQQLVVVAFFFPTTFLALPILGGVLIDYIGVVPILQYLNIVYIIGASIFIPAYCLTNIWLITVASLFFGFSLFLTYMATFIYLCNTFITKSRKITYLRRVQGVYIFIGCFLLCVASSIDFIGGDAWKVSFAFGCLMILISSVTSFSLSIKTPHNIIRPVNGSPAAMTSSSPVEISENSESLVQRNTFEGTFIDYNEKFDLDEMNVQTLSRFIRTLGVKNNLKIVTLGIITGVAWTLNAPKPILSTDFDWVQGLFIAHYLAYAIFGLGLSFISWNKKRLERAIIISSSFYVLCVAFDTVTMPIWLSCVRYGIQTATNATNYYVCLLYFPYVINFKLEGLGKAIGLFWWTVSVEVFLSIWLGQYRNVGLLVFELVIVLPAVLSVVIFASLIWLESRSEVKIPKNSLPICI